MRGSIVTFAVGAIIAVLAVFLMNRFMAAGTGAPQAVNGVAMGGVVVAQRDLKVGTPLRPDLLVAQQWPANVRPALSFPSPQDILGDGSEPRVLLHDVRAGEPILQSAVSGFGERASLSRRVATGKRAVSVRINDVSGVAGFTLPGDNVDILLTRDMDGTMVTDVILQNIPVLGIDQLTDQQRDQPVVARTATVEVDPVQAQKLVLAQQLGTLSFALRNADVAETVATRRVGPADLTGPVRAAPRGPTVRIRRGAELTDRAVPM